MPQAVKHTEKTTTWFAEARFGMFIHWGLYSIPAVGEWTMLNQHYSPDVYRRLADRFKPKRFDAAAWVALAKEAGAQYVVLTTRHHDGFSLFDSKVSDFTSTRTAAGRDFVAEYTWACRAAGLKVGLYYSLCDWRFPTHRHGRLVPAVMRRMREYVREQVRELCTNYGRIDLLWYDGPFGVDENGVTWGRKWPDWDGVRLHRMVRRLQPGIAINDRAMAPGDFATPEQEIKPPSDGRLWEACMTINDNWGFHKTDRNWKPAWQLVSNLVLCASNGGSYLLNVGPKADGTVPAPSVQRMREIGRWLRDHGEAIYGTRAGGLNPAAVSFRRFTRKGNFFYMFEPHWPGTVERIRNFPNRVVEARLLKSGKRLAVAQEGRTVTLTGLPSGPEDPLMSVIKLEVAG
jgi:alpha-L-fucosidase